MSRCEAAAAGPELTSAATDELQTMLVAVTTEYAARVRAGERLDPFGSAAACPTATDIAVTVSAMLERAGIEPFELGLWRAWGTPIGNEEHHGHH